MAAAQQNNSVPFKVYLIDENGQQVEVRRFGIDQYLVSNYAILCDRLRVVFPKIQEENIKIYWKDGDGDEIVISSDEELVVALTQKDVCKLFVIIMHATPQSAGAAESCEQTEDDADLNKNLHVNIWCDGCEKEIEGTRFKCLQCEDYDLCRICENSGVHAGHPMLRLNTPVAQRHKFYTFCQVSRNMLRGIDGKKGPKQSPSKKPTYDLTKLKALLDNFLSPLELDILIHGNDADDACYAEGQSSVAAKTPSKEDTNVQPIVENREVEENASISATADSNESAPVSQITDVSSTEQQPQQPSTSTEVHASVETPTVTASQAGTGVQNTAMQNHMLQQVQREAMTAAAVAACHQFIQQQHQQGLMNSTRSRAHTVPIIDPETSAPVAPPAMYRQASNNVMSSLFPSPRMAMPVPPPTQTPTSAYNFQYPPHTTSQSAVPITENPSGYVFGPKPTPAAYPSAVRQTFTYQQSPRHIGGPLLSTHTNPTVQSVNCPPTTYGSTFNGNATAPAYAPPNWANVFNPFPQQVRPPVTSTGSLFGAPPVQLPGNLPPPLIPTPAPVPTVQRTADRPVQVSTQRPLSAAERSEALLWHAVDRMVEMGFNNDDGRLFHVLQLVDGNVDRAIERLVNHNN